MAAFNIKATYEYEGVVHADSEEQARKLFWQELNSYYSSTEDETIEEVCEHCEKDIEFVCICDEESEETENN